MNAFVHALYSSPQNISPPKVGVAHLSPSQLSPPGHPKWNYITLHLYPPDLPILCFPLHSLPSNIIYILMFCFIVHLPQVECKLPKSKSVLCDVHPVSQELGQRIHNRCTINIRGMNGLNGLPFPYCFLHPTPQVVWHPAWQWDRIFEIGTGTTIWGGGWKWLLS